MKRFTICLILAVLIASIVSAQTRNERQRNNSVTIDGIVKLERRTIALKSGDSVYYIPTLARYTDVIGLNEGANISVDGYVFRNIIYPTRVAIGDKSYIFAASGPGFAIGMLNQNFGAGGNFFHSRNNQMPCCNIIQDRNDFMQQRRNTPSRNGRR
ncbi:MAG: hypothetical protein LBQ89_00350 [Treponema sp.]|nr:hypothetical protein [Treponema sp.]